MSIVTNLTEKEIQKVQIDEGVIVIDYGEDTEFVLAPCRGGGEFSAKAKIRDIDFDGKNGKTAGMQAVEEQEAFLKVNTICMSQENLIRAMPWCRVEGEGDSKVIKNPKMGVIPESAYSKNVTMFAKLIDGKYKKITIYKGMHEDGISTKAVQKAEGELALNFFAHYSTDELDGDLWSIEEISQFTMRKAVQAASAPAPAPAAPSAPKTTK